ncbi:MAG: hypothetical protein DMG13_05840 [Acidobacteria bacterium]|nr:MAG: hypothetical protein DMG13_05840 [Acidobacteriota bacterium]
MAKQAILTTDLAEHPASRAWAAAGGNDIPTRIQILGRKKKSAVYRLGGAGPGGAGIIAKRSRLEDGLTERTIYAEILPSAGINALQSFGFTEELDTGFAWLFIEDAGGKEHAPHVNHRDLISDWLGLMHARTARVGAAAHLPDRSASHYRKHLESARRTILQHLGNPLMLPEDVSLLHSVVDQCDFLEARWNQIESFCNEIPRTLVHGDFVAKNMCVRNSRNGSELLLFDWETAGWGVPAADLAQLGLESMASVDLTVYRATVRESWPQVCLGDVERLGAVGSLFRLLAMIGWESTELQYGSVQKCMGSMRVYQAAMAQVLRTEWRQL